MNHVLNLLAQASDAVGPANPASPANPGNPANPAGPGAGGQVPAQNPLLLFWGLMIAMIVFMFIMSRKQRKREEKRKNSMIDNLSKNDRVMTIGGVMGTVVTVKDNYVVVKVDEGTNTKMNFAKRAIQQVLTGDEEPVLEEK